jgi:hypothetical protein
MAGTRGPQFSKVPSGTKGPCGRPAHFLPSLTGLLYLMDALPSHEWLGYGRPVAPRRDPFFTFTGDVVPGHFPMPLRSFASLRQIHLAKAGTARCAVSVAEHSVRRRKKGILPRSFRPADGDAAARRPYHPKICQRHNSQKSFAASWWQLTGKMPVPLPPPNAGFGVRV